MLIFHSKSLRSFSTVTYADYRRLSVGDTLYFAARARAPRNIPGGVSRERYAEHLRDVVTPLSFQLEGR